MRRPERIVVVGNGIAGVTACDTLRSAGFDGELTVVGDERHAAYSRPALSKALLRDASDTTSHELPASAHGGRELLGIHAVRLDAGRRVVHLGDGTELPYDGVVLASGTRARRLGGSGAAAQLTLRGLDDAFELRRRLAGRPSVVVLGGGALGMEIASSCLAAGCRTTLVSHEAPLARQAGAYLSDIFTAAAVRHGLDLVPSRAVELRETDGGTAVVLADGTVLEAELVVSAIGDSPNTGWLADSGLLTDGRLEVDSRGRVRPEVVAAGDVAAFPTPHGVRRVPLWTSAIEQGKAAALALLRGDDAPELAFQPYFWTEQFGLNLKASGFLPVDGPPEIVDGAPSDGTGLMRWEHADGSGTAAALNYRIPVPKLRRLANTVPTASPSPSISGSPSTSLSTKDDAPNRPLSRI